MHDCSSLHYHMQFVMIAVSYTGGTVQYTVNFNLYLILVMIRTLSSIPRYRISSHFLSISLCEDNTMVSLIVLYMYNPRYIVTPYELHCCVFCLVTSACSADSEAILHPRSRTRCICNSVHWEACQVWALCGEKSTSISCG